MGRTPQHIRDHRGFTLVEVIVTLCIMTILASAAVMSIVPLFQNYKAMERQSNAEILYLAAQSGLSDLKEAGQLDVGLSETPVPTNLLSSRVSAAATAAGQDAQKGTQFEAPASLRDEDANLIDDNLRCYSSDIADQRAVLDLIDPSLGNKTSSAGFQTVGGSQGHYYIELNAKAGYVYSVFYSEDAFDYLEASGNRSDDQWLAEHGIAYYGDTVLGTYDPQSRTISCFIGYFEFGSDDATSDITGMYGYNMTVTISRTGKKSVVMDSAATSILPIANSIGRTAYGVIIDSRNTTDLDVARAMLSSEQVKTSGSELHNLKIDGLTEGTYCFFEAKSGSNNALLTDSWRPVTASGATYKVNSDFAAAITLAPGNIEAYQIRTAAQIGNINKYTKAPENTTTKLNGNKWVHEANSFAKAFVQDAEKTANPYLTYSYYQTHDIDLAGEWTPIGTQEGTNDKWAVAFSGSYCAAFTGRAKVQSLVDSTITLVPEILTVEAGTKITSFNINLKPTFQLKNFGKAPAYGYMGSDANKGSTGGVIFGSSVDGVGDGSAASVAGLFAENLGKLSYVTLISSEAREDSSLLNPSMRSFAQSNIATGALSVGLLVGYSESVGENIAELVNPSVQASGSSIAIGTQDNPLIVKANVAATVGLVAGIVNNTRVTGNGKGYKQDVLSLSEHATADIYCQVDNRLVSNGSVFGLYQRDVMGQGSEGPTASNLNVSVSDSALRTYSRQTGVTGHYCVASNGIGIVDGNLETLTVSATGGDATVEAVSLNDKETSTAPTATANVVGSLIGGVVEHLAINASDGAKVVVESKSAAQRNVHCANVLGHCHIYDKAIASNSIQTCSIKSSGGALVSVYGAALHGGVRSGNIIGYSQSAISAPQITVESGGKLAAVAYTLEGDKWANTNAGVSTAGSAYASNIFGEYDQANGNASPLSAANLVITGEGSLATSVACTKQKVDGFRTMSSAGLVIGKTTNSVWGRSGEYTTATISNGANALIVTGKMPVTVDSSGAAVSDADFLKGHLSFDEDGKVVLETGVSSTGDSSSGGLVGYADGDSKSLVDVKVDVTGASATGKPSTLEVKAYTNKNTGKGDVFAFAGGVVGANKRGDKTDSDTRLKLTDLRIAVTDGAVVDIEADATDSAGASYAGGLVGYTASKPSTLMSAKLVSVEGVAASDQTKRSTLNVSAKSNQASSYAGGLAGYAYGTGSMGEGTLVYLSSNALAKVVAESNGGQASNDEATKSYAGGVFGKHAEGKVDAIERGLLALDWGNKNETPELLTQAIGGYKNGLESQGVICGINDAHNALSQEPGLEKTNQHLIYSDQYVEGNVNKNVSNSQNPGVDPKANRADGWDYRAYLTDSLNGRLMVGYFEFDSEKNDPNSHVQTVSAWYAYDYRQGSSLSNTLKVDNGISWTAYGVMLKDETTTEGYYEQGEGDLIARYKNIKLDNSADTYTFYELSPTMNERFQCGGRTFYFNQDFAAAVGRDKSEVRQVVDDNLGTYQIRTGAQLQNLNKKNAVWGNASGNYLSGFTFYETHDVELSKNWLQGGEYGEWQSIGLLNSTSNTATSFDSTLYGAYGVADGVQEPEEIAVANLVAPSNSSDDRQFSINLMSSFKFASNSFTDGKYSDNKNNEVTNTDEVGVGLFARVKQGTLQQVKVAVPAGETVKPYTLVEQSSIKDKAKPANIGLVTAVLEPSATFQDVEVISSGSLDLSIAVASAWKEVRQGAVAGICGNANAVVSVSVVGDGSSPNMQNANMVIAPAHNDNDNALCLGAVVGKITKSAPASVSFVGQEGGSAVVGLTLAKAETVENLKGYKYVGLVTGRIEVDIPSTSELSVEVSSSAHVEVSAATTTPIRAYYDKDVLKYAMDKHAYAGSLAGYTAKNVSVADAAVHLQSGATLDVNAEAAHTRAYAGALGGYWTHVAGAEGSNQLVVDGATLNVTSKSMRAGGEDTAFAGGMVGYTNGNMTNMSGLLNGATVSVVAKANEENIGSKTHAGGAVGYQYNSTAGIILDLPKLSLENGSNLEVSAQSFDKDVRAGGVVGTIATPSKSEGTMLLVDASSEVSVDAASSGACCAGGVFAYASQSQTIRNGVKLEQSAAANSGAKMSIKANSSKAASCAGGFVGQQTVAMTFAGSAVDAGAQAQLTVSSISGENIAYAGGVAGKSVAIEGPEEKDFLKAVDSTITVTATSSRSDEATDVEASYAGGLVGYASGLRFVGLVENINNTKMTVAAKDSSDFAGRTYAGGAFGLLSGSGTDCMELSSTVKATVASTVVLESKTNTRIGYAGGFAGYVGGLIDVTNTLLDVGAVEDAAVRPSITVEASTGTNSVYAGGAIGRLSNVVALGKVPLKANNAEIIVKASSEKASYAAGVLGQVPEPISFDGLVADISNSTVSVTANGADVYCGGAVGQAAKKVTLGGGLSVCDGATLTVLGDSDSNVVFSGGFAGSLADVAGSADADEVVVKNSTVKVTSKNKRNTDEDKTFAGGMVGKASGAFTDITEHVQSSTLEVNADAGVADSASNDDNNNNSSKPFAGGVAGYLSAATEGAPRLEISDSTVKILAKSYNRDARAGGVAGFTNAAAFGSDSLIADGASVVSVSAESNSVCYSGGLVGQANKTLGLAVESLKVAGGTTLTVKSDSGSGNVFSGGLVGAATDVLSGVESQNGTSGEKVVAYEAVVDDSTVNVTATSKKNAEDDTAFAGGVVGKASGTFVNVDVQTRNGTLNVTAKTEAANPESGGISGKSYAGGVVGSMSVATNNAPTLNASGGAAKITAASFSGDVRAGGVVGYASQSVAFDGDAVKADAAAVITVLSQSGRVCYSGGVVGQANNALWGCGRKLGPNQVREGCRNVFKRAKNQGRRALHKVWEEVGAGHRGAGVSQPSQLDELVQGLPGSQGGRRGVPAPG